MSTKLGLFPDAASTIAGRVDALYLFLVAVSLFFGVLIAILIIVFAVKYRRRSESEEPEQIHGSLLLELAWSVIPLGIAMVIFVWGATIFATIKRPPDNALQVNVVGKQWMWKLQHMEGKREINELHVPVGRPVKLTLTSEDVIHSFYVPAFRIKQDAVPGRYTTAWFEATKIGTYHLFCAEYCGTEHSRMIGRVVVMEPADYQAWLATEGEPVPMGVAAAAAAAAPAGAAAAGGGEQTLVAAGQKLFVKLGCQACHSGQPGGLGPALAGVFGHEVKLADGSTVLGDENYMRESIINPQAKIVAGYAPVMPTFKGQVDEEQLLQLIAYIKSLAAPPTAAAGGQGS